ncbi:MAG TPA: hypothetical protein VF170_00035, partial [Planctomycetaceae bacterium]
MFDWLATRPGRLAAFFLLYVTEGIPLGYAATFVATLLRKEDISTEVIGAFVAIFYIPWSFKWAAGPVVDLARSRRLGPRRAWIVGTQLAMVVTLAACSGIGMESITRVLEARDAAQTDARLDDPRSAAPDATAFLVFTAL